MTHQDGKKVEVYLCHPTDDGTMEWCTKVFLEIPWPTYPIEQMPPKPGPPPPDPPDTYFETKGDDPNPVPWVRDLAKVMSAYSSLRALSDEGLAERLSADLRAAGEDLVREHAPSASLHVVG